MTRNIDNCDTYVQQLEDALNAYDVALMELAINGPVENARLYTCIVEYLGDTRRHAINSSLARARKEKA
jgi:hypothetical protein